MAKENEPPQPTAASTVPEPAMKIAKVDISSALRVKKLSEHAILPKRGSQYAAGYDLSR
jgi:dUTP pyrophosphatase